MAPAAHSPEQAREHRTFALWLTTIPTARVCARPDGSADSSISAGSTIPASPPYRRMTGAGRLPFTGRPERTVDYWPIRSASGEAGEIEGRLPPFRWRVSLVSFLALRRSTTTEIVQMVGTKHRHRRTKALNACLPEESRSGIDRQGNVAGNPFSKPYAEL